MCDCVKEKYCISCYNQKKYLKLKKCSCDKDFFAFYKIKNKLFCSKCYMDNGGKLIIKKKAYKEDSEIEIVNTLNSIYNFNKYEVKLILMQIKNCNKEQDLVSVMKEVEKKNIHFNSKQAEVILNNIKNKFEVKKPYIYENVICSKVVDYWNMQEKTHGVGYCYFSDWGEKPKTINDAILKSKNNRDAFSNNFKKLESILLLLNN